MQKKKKNAKRKEKKEVAVSPLSCDHSTLCVKAIERLIAGGGGEGDGCYSQMYYLAKF